MTVLTDAEIEKCYADGRGMVEFARRIEAATVRSVMVELREIYGLDGHQWSKRHCSTCQRITDRFGLAYGCILYARDLEAQRKALAGEKTP